MYDYSVWLYNYIQGTFYTAVELTHDLLISIFYTALLVIVLLSVLRKVAHLTYPSSTNDL